MPLYFIHAGVPCKITHQSGIIQLLFGPLQKNLIKPACNFVQLCVKKAHLQHTESVLADQRVVPSWIYSLSLVLHSVSFLEPLPQSLCLKWPLTFLVINSINWLQRDTKNCKMIHARLFIMLLWIRLCPGVHRLMIRLCSMSVLNSHLHTVSSLSLSFQIADVRNAVISIMGIHYFHCWIN